MNVRGFLEADNNKKKDIVGRVTCKTARLMHMGGSFALELPSMNINTAAQTTAGMAIKACHNHFTPIGELIHENRMLDHYLLNEGRDEAQTSSILVRSAGVVLPSWLSLTTFTPKVNNKLMVGADHVKALPMQNNNAFVEVQEIGEFKNLNKMSTAKPCRNHQNRTHFPA